MQFPFHELSLTPGNFADSLKGLRFIQVSDLLINTKTEPQYIQHLVQQINEKEVDLVLFTGGIIGSFVKKVKQQLHLLKDLNAPCYYVTGNHDVLYGAKALRNELCRIGFTCLDDACAHLIINETPLQLVGLSDRYSRLKAHHRPVHDLLAQLDESISTLLITHQPKDVEFTKPYRIDIQLSALPHNADAYPFAEFLKKYQPYYKGLYVKGKTLLFVSNGLNRTLFQLKRHHHAQIPLFTIN
jgi:predicted MPP superfamily phosphohydrolase